jgi:ribosomal protein S27E
VITITPAPRPPAPLVVEPRFIAGRCPACNAYGTLFVGAGGHITCSLLDCPAPSTVDVLLHPSNGAP